MREIHYEMPTLFGRPDRLHHPLYVVTCCFNFVRYHARWKLFEDFQLHMEQSGVKLYICEVALGDRDFVVTEPNNPTHLQLRTWHELWHKETALNLLVQRLPADWVKVAWVDADVRFLRPDWANETLHRLEHHPIVQCWSNGYDLDSRFHFTNHVSPMISFAHAYLTRQDVPWDPKKPVPVCDPDEYYAPEKPGLGSIWGHTGLAWACRREAWNIMGGLPDYCILGSGDWYTAFALVGELRRLRGLMKTRVAPLLQAFQERIRRGQWEWRSLQGNLGVVPGTLIQYYHGSKANRRYVSRDKILIENKFDPLTDLVRDWQGLWMFTDTKPDLRRAVQQYFVARNEDD